jgi:hypothetical protein
VKNKYRCGALNFWHKTKNSDWEENREKHKNLDFVTFIEPFYGTFAT